MSNIQPVTMANPPKEIIACMWLWYEGGVGCARSRAMSGALAQNLCNSGCGRCSHQMSERAHTPSPCLGIDHKPLETNNNVVVELCKRWQRCAVGLKGQMEVLCWAMASP
jgi:hypothetical protein